MWWQNVNILKIESPSTTTLKKSYSLASSYSKGWEGLEACEDKVSWDLYDCVTFAYGNVKLWEQLHFSHIRAELSMVWEELTWKCRTNMNRPLNNHKVTYSQRILLRGDTR